MASTPQSAVRALLGPPGRGGRALGPAAGPRISTRCLRPRTGVLPVPLSHFLTFPLFASPPKPVTPGWVPSCHLYGRKAVFPPTRGARSAGLARPDYFRWGGPNFPPSHCGRVCGGLPRSQSHRFLSRKKVLVLVSTPPPARALRTRIPRGTELPPPAWGDQRHGRPGRPCCRIPEGGVEPLSCRLVAWPPPPSTPSSPRPWPQLAGPRKSEKNPPLGGNGCRARVPCQPGDESRHRPQGSRPVGPAALPLWHHPVVIVVAGRAWTKETQVSRAPGGPGRLHESQTSEPTLPVRGVKSKGRPGPFMAHREDRDSLDHFFFANHFFGRGSEPPHWVVSPPAWRSKPYFHQNPPRCLKHPAQARTPIWCPGRLSAQQPPVSSVVLRSPFTPDGKQKKTAAKTRLELGRGAESARPPICCEAKAP